MSQAAPHNKHPLSNRTVSNKHGVMKSDDSLIRRGEMSDSQIRSARWSRLRVEQ
jgi:hypothetical protein